MKKITLQDVLADPSLKEQLTIPQLQNLVLQLRSLTSGLSIKTGVPDNVISLATEYSNGKWKPAKHLALLADLLHQLASGDRSRLLVSMPPRHGKSELISYWFPIWFLANNPDKRVILCSYEADFAAGWGRRVRNAILEFGDKLGLEIDESSSAAHRWDLKSGGGMMTAGAGGPITGKGAHCLIIDDPFKNSEEASSETIREKVWDWWQTTALTRLEPGGFPVIVATRWHQDDLIGRLERDSNSGAGLPFDVINFPALAEADDPIGRQVDEALWPERYSKEKLLEIKQGTTAYNWSALYQQRPSPEEGGGVKRVWWKHYGWNAIPQDMDVYIQSWDLAFKDTKSSDFTVGQVWGRKGGRFYLLDQSRGRMNSVEVIKAIRNLSSKWPRATAKLIEDKANGPAVIATLQEEVSGIIPIKVKASKDARLQAVLPLIEAGNVHLPGRLNANNEWIPSHPWVSEFIEEHAAFPNGTNDDQLDACVQALAYLQPQAWRELNSAWREAKLPKQPKDMEEKVKNDFHLWAKKKIKKSDKKFNKLGKLTSFMDQHRRRMW